MQRDTIVLFDGRQINDADSIVVNFNLLFSMSTALIGSVDYYFVNQVIKQFRSKLLGICILANVNKKLLEVLCFRFTVLN